MTEDSPLHNKQQRKKARRKDRQQRERQAHRNLDAITSSAVDQALAAAELVTALGARDRVLALDLELASMSEAQFVRKRVNDALNVDEWLTDVRVVISERNAAGATVIELRIERESQRLQD